MAWLKYEAKNPSGAFELRKTLRRHKVHFVIDGQTTTYVREGGGHTSGQMRRGRNYGATVTQMAEAPPEFPTPCGTFAVSEEQAWWHSRGCKQCQQVRHGSNAVMAESQKEDEMPKGFSDGHAGVYTRGHQDKTKFELVEKSEADGHKNGYTSAGIPLDALQAPEPHPESHPESQTTGELLQRLSQIEERALEVGTAASELRNALGGLAKMEEEIEALKRSYAETERSLAERFAALQKSASMTR